MNNERMNNICCSSDLDLCIFFLLILLLCNFESHYWGQKENQAQGFSLALDLFRIRVIVCIFLYSIL